MGDEKVDREICWICLIPIFAELNPFCLDYGYLFSSQMEKTIKVHCIHFENPIITVDMSFKRMFNGLIKLEFEYI